jgi:hypothetical protein
MFSIDIIPTKFGENAIQLPNNKYRYIALKNNTPYKVVLCNNLKTRCDVVLNIDNELMGNFRIPPLSKIGIERPLAKDKKFTFVKEGTVNSILGGLVKGSNSNGLVSATFYPEMEMDDLDYKLKICSRSNSKSNYELGSNSANLESFSLNRSNQSNQSNYSSGGTVLQGKSEQRFNMVNKIENIDFQKITTLQLRLVSDNNVIPVSNEPPRIESLYGNNIRSYNEVEPKI